MRIGPYPEVGQKSAKLNNNFNKNYQNILL